ncbi:MAG: tetratricopeptide repeat protein [Methanomicrobiales archaeon]|nr:tetratricopeptide repeat protein [Methanomicrobiales archaeon]
MTPKDPEPHTGDEDIPGLSGTRRKPSQYLGDGIGQRPGPAPGYDSPEAAPDPVAAIPGDSATREAIYERVSVLLEKGRYHDAEGILTRGLEIYPESVDLLKELGVLYHLQGRYGKAARTFTRVMNITGEGKQSLSWKIASLYHKALEEYEGADPGLSLASFDQVLALDPSDREALAGKIAALRILGRLEEAQRLVEAGLALVPPGPSILYQEGWLRMDEGRPDLASAAFERAALADPAWPEPVLSRALALERLGRGEEGERLLQDLAASRRGDPGLRAELGWYTLMLHHLGEARGIFLELARGDGDLGGFHGLAALLLATGRTREAAVITGRLSGAMPRDPLLHVNHSMVLARAGGSRDLTDATVSARRALSLDPRFAPAHACLGGIAFKQGKLDAAEAHFRDANRLSDPRAHRNLGLLACARGRWKEAEPHLVHAIRLDPMDAPAWAGLGALALHSGKAEEAVLHLRCASTLDPWDAGAARGLAIALARCGDTGGAEEVIRRTLGLTPGPERWVLLLDLAALLISMGGPAGNPVLDDEAQRLLGKAGALRPDEPAILFYEGVVESRLGNPGKAMERFTSARVREEFRIPALENLRHLKERTRSRAGILAGISGARSALAAFCLLQLAALWLFFVARLVSEIAFVLLVSIFSVLFALTTFLPARNGEPMKEIPLDLVIPARTFVPGPEGEMVPPSIRLRTALRP